MISKSFQSLRKNCENRVFKYLKMSKHCDFTSGTNISCKFKSVVAVALLVSIKNKILHMHRAISGKRDNVKKFVTVATFSVQASFKVKKNCVNYSALVGAK